MIFQVEDNCPWAENKEEELGRRVDTLEVMLVAVGEKVGAIEVKVDAVDKKVDALKQLLLQNVAPTTTVGTTTTATTTTTSTTHTTSEGRFKLHAAPKFENDIAFRIQLLLN